MQSRSETPQVLAGLGVGVLIAFLGVIGAGASLGYALVLLVLGVLLIAGACKACAPNGFVSLFATTAEDDARYADHPSGLQLSSPRTAGSAPLYAFLLAGTLAALPDAGVLAATGNTATMFGLLGAWGGGLVIMTMATRANLGTAEFVALGMGTIILLATLASIIGGITFGAVAGAGYLIAIAFGYVAHRLDQPDHARRVAATASASTMLQSTEMEQWLAEELGRADLFDSLSHEQRTEVIKIGRVREFQPGDVLGREGERSEYLYCILQGRVQLSVRSPLGQLTVRIAEAGESLPLAALIGDGTLVTTAVVLTEVSAMELPRAQLMELCERRNDIGMPIFLAIAEVLGSRYRATLRRLTQRVDQVVQESELWANV